MIKYEIRAASLTKNRELGTDSGGNGKKMHEKIRENGGARDNANIFLLRYCKT